MKGYAALDQRAASNIAFLCELEEQPAAAEKEKMKKSIDRELVAKMYKEGKKATEIAKMIGCSKPPIYEIIHQIQEPDEIDYGRIKALYNAERSIRWIAEDMGLDVQTVGRAIKQLHENKEI